MRTLITSFLGAVLALAVVGAAVFTANALTAQELPPGIQRTSPWADDSPCSLAARYRVGLGPWEGGTCSPGQLQAYEDEIMRLYRLFAENDILPSASPCSVNFIDNSKLGNGFRPGQALTQPGSITCNEGNQLLNIPVSPVDRFGNVIGDIVLINGLGAGFDPGSAPYYQLQAVSSDPKSRCYQLEANACLRLLAATDDAPQNLVADTSPAPALPPERPNVPAPVREMNAHNFVPGAPCFGLQHAECWNLVHNGINP